MKFSDEMKQASKITLVTIAATSIFAILIRLSVLIPLGSNHPDLGYFVKNNLLWLIVVILLIIGLCSYIKKADGEFNLSFLNNPMVRFTAGLLILCEGILNLFVRIYSLFLNIQTFQQAVANLGENADEMIRTLLISSIIPIALYLLQVLLGLYFISYRSKNKRSETIDDNNEED